MEPKDMEQNEALGWNRAAQQSCEPASSEIILPIQAIRYRENPGGLATNYVVQY